MSAPNKGDDYMKKLLFLLLAAVMFSAAAAMQKKSRKKAEKKLPAGLEVREYPCSYDNSMQKAVVGFAKGDQPRPLVVALHTWSYGYQGGAPYAAPAVRKNFHVIAPDFRGRNNARNPLSMGSDAAVSDILDAVKWMKTMAKVDEDRIYIIGGSGGGHMALLMAGRHPEIWAAVSVWCPISDIKKWCEHHKGSGYGKHIIDNLKGDPRTDKNAEKEAVKRSPATFLANAVNIPIDIGTGIHDGHTGAVPIDHALNAYNILAPEEDKVPQEHIDFMLKNEKAPAGTPKITDQGYGKRVIHYRKTSKFCRVTIFEGGHNILTAYSYDWISLQKKGSPAVWKSKKGSGKAEVLTK